jgi:plastocyanin
MQLPRRLAPLVAVALVATLLLPGTSLAATTWKVGVGAQSADEGRQANFFFPGEIWVDVGDTVQWTQRTDEIHTVTFLSGSPRPPLFVPNGSGGIAPNLAAVLPQGGATYDGTGVDNSGLLTTPGQQYSLTFSKAGDFLYVCLVHEKMSGTVHVQNAGAAYPFTQARYDQQAHAEAAKLLGQAQGLAGQGLAAARSAGRNAVTAGIGKLLNTGSLAVLRFEPDQTTVHVGQTVTWTNRDPETPHTVTFGTEPPGSPFGAFPASGTDLNNLHHATVTSTTQSVNSGFLGADLPLGTTFSATFDSPGTYSYFCALHDDLGMKGTITVLP